MPAPLHPLPFNRLPLTVPTVLCAPVSQSVLRPYLSHFLSPFPFPSTSRALSRPCPVLPPSLLVVRPSLGSLPPSRPRRRSPRPTRSVSTVSALPFGSFSSFLHPISLLPPLLPVSCLSTFLVPLSTLPHSVYLFPWHLPPSLPSHSSSPLSFPQSSPHPLPSARGLFPLRPLSRSPLSPFSLPGSPLPVRWFLFRYPSLLFTPFLFPHPSLSPVYHHPLNPSPSLPPPSLSSPSLVRQSVSTGSPLPPPPRLTSGSSLSLSLSLSISFDLPPSPHPSPLFLLLAHGRSRMDETVESVPDLRPGYLHRQHDRPELLEHADLQEEVKEGPAVFHH